MATIMQKIRAVIRLNGFFWFIMGFFVFEAAWIALSATFPQAFDEDFHFGLIQAYSHYWLPFLSSPPPGTEAYGAMTRDPSFLYHFLMSFPYRLISRITHNVPAQIVSLRLLNVALFSAGLIISRKVLKNSGLSSAATNVVLFMFILIPIVPQVAGQINYDNLLMPMVAWACLLVLKLIRDVQKERLNLALIIGLLTVCLVATMVKYEFAPIFLGIVLFVAGYLFVCSRGHIRRFLRSLLRGLTQYSDKGKLIVLIVLFVASFGLFIQRDGVNFIRYHTLAPDCGKVLSIESCNNYPVWSHDYASHQLVASHVAPLTLNPFEYVLQWVYWLWYRLFFAVNGPASSYQNFPPLPLPIACFALVLIAAVIFIAIKAKTIFSDSRYVFFGVIIALYLLVLLVEGYLKYRSTAVLELMNGRYLLPVLLPGAVLAIRAFSLILVKRPILKTSLAVAAMLLFLQGGGLFTFLSRSDASWNWQNNAVINVNNTARSIVEPVLIDGPRYYYTYMWFFN